MVIQHELCQIHSFPLNLGNSLLVRERVRSTLLQVADTQHDKKIMISLQFLKIIMDHPRALKIILDDIL